VTDRTKRMFAAAGLLIALAAVVFAALRFGGPLWTLLRDPEKTRELISNWGIWAPLGLIALQVVQIIAAPLPGNVVAIVSGYAFGLVRGFVFCMVGVVFGAALAFLVSRVLGRRLLKLFVPAAALDRFDRFVVAKGPFYVFLLLLLPNPIGDWLYYLAGLTPIPLLLFLAMVLVARLPSNLIEAFIGVQVSRFGSRGYQLEWWQWLVFALLFVAVTVVYFLNRRRIERFLLRLARMSPPEES
jgi:uncharacterized membrane protein YdjX (TVP38/TMEM64 family)